MSTSDPTLVKVGVFGAGRMGKEHIKNLLNHKNVGVAYVVTKSVETLQSLKDEFPLLECNSRCPCVFLTSQEGDRVFSDPSVDAIVIASPNPEHEHQIVKAVRHKKAIFCEKPLATSLDAAKMCLSLAEDHQIPILCAFQRRFDPSFMSARSKIQSGEVGKIHLIKICSRDPELPPAAYLKTSAGFVHDSTVHDLDMACWLADEYPSEVYCAAHANYQSVKESGDVDTLVVTLRFQTGILAVIDQSRTAAYGYDQRLEVLGDKGMILVGNQPENDTISADFQGFQSTRTKQYFIERYKDAYKTEIQHFIDIVSKKATPSTNTKSIINNMHLAEAVMQSIEAKKPVSVIYD